MAVKLRLTRTTCTVLRALLDSDPKPTYGTAIIAATGMSTGTLYPILERLEYRGAATSQWEDVAEMEKEPGRPRRRYYALTDAGRRIAREADKTTV